MLYQITVPGLKRHYCNNFYLMQEVLENLKINHKIKDFEIRSFDKNEKYFWDPGGSVYRPENIFILFLDNTLKLSGYACYWNLFKSESMKIQRVDDGNFFKIYGRMTVLCLSQHQKNQLFQQVTQNEKEYDEISEM